MTEAEQLAKAWVEVRGNEWGDGKPWTVTIANAQRVIDAGGRFTPPEPPDPAEQIAEVYWEAEAPPQIKARFTSLIADGWIVPGPRCEGHEPPPDPLAQAVLDAAEAWVERFALTTPMSAAGAALLDAVRARREAQP